MLGHHGKFEIQSARELNWSGRAFLFPESFPVFNLVFGTFDLTESYTVDFEFPAQGHRLDFCQ